MTTVPPALDARFVASALGDRPVPPDECNQTFARAVIDSRLVESGDLFVALPGEQTDGHRHAAAAVAAGASGCVLRQPVAGTDRATRFYVPDTLTALQQLAAAWRAALPDLRLIGITGSVGKTTTKLLLAQLLGDRYRVQASPLNYNNEIGVPLCLLELRTDTERSVLELGMYTTGEIALLCRWAKPQTGVVLNVGAVHLERAGSIDAITAAKRELVEALPADGVAVLNADDPRVLGMAEHSRAPVVLFGTSERAHVRGRHLNSLGGGGFSFVLEVGDDERQLTVPLPGSHLLTNLLAAIAVALSEGLGLDEIVRRVERIAVPLRLNLSELPGPITLLDDTYNANPDSMRAALDLLRELPGRHLALLGDMLELGTETDPAHREVGERAAAEVDVLLTVGALGEEIARSALAHGAPDVQALSGGEEAVAVLEQRLRPGDVLLVKGSHALHLERVVAELRERLTSTARPCGPGRIGGATHPESER